MNRVVVATILLIVIIFVAHRRHAEMFGPLATGQTMTYNGAIAMIDGDQKRVYPDTGTWMWNGSPIRAFVSKSTWGRYRDSGVPMTRIGMYPAGYGEGDAVYSNGVYGRLSGGVLTVYMSPQGTCVPITGAVKMMPTELYSIMPKNTVALTAPSTLYTCT